MFKSFIALCAALCISGVANAETLTTLARPVTAHSPFYVSCIAKTFNADDSSNGTCQSVSWGGCSGRGCQPTYTYIVYVTTWDDSGNVLANTFCGTFVSHVPALHTWTYQPGYSAANCYLPVAQGLTTVLRMGPNGYEQWYGYETTSTDGAYELLVSGQSGVLGRF